MASKSWPFTSRQHSWFPSEFFKLAQKLFEKCLPQASRLRCILKLGREVPVGTFSGGTCAQRGGWRLHSAREGACTTPHWPFHSMAGLKAWKISSITISLSPSPGIAIPYFWKPTAGTGYIRNSKILFLLVERSQTNLIKLLKYGDLGFAHSDNILMPFYVSS